MGLLEYARFFYHRLFVRKAIYTQKADSIFSIDYEFMKKQGVSLIIFDVDDTLTWHHGELEEKTKLLLKKLSKSFKLAVYTNSGRGRRTNVAVMLSSLDLYVAPFGGKPGIKGFVDIMHYFKISPDSTAMIGDRPGTDIWGAYLAEIKFRILIKPYSEYFNSKKTPLPYHAIRKIENF